MDEDFENETEVFVLSDDDHVYAITPTMEVMEKCLKMTWPDYKLLQVHESKWTVETDPGVTLSLNRSTFFKCAESLI